MAASRPPLNAEQHVQPAPAICAAEALVRCLAREGVDTAFGVASGYLSTFLDALRRAEIRAITNLHECAASFAAAGYSLASGKLGVVYTQSGPGTTNAATGVAAAYMDSIPQLLLATQAPSRMYGRDAHQEVTGASHSADQLDMYRSMADACYRPPTAETMIRCARRAFATIHTRRTTAVLEVAADLWMQPLDHDDLAPEQYRPRSTVLDDEGIEQACALLREAKRPVLLVGHRAVHRGVSAELLALCEEQDVPCATVDFAKGAIPEDHPLALGILGSCGHESAAEYFKHADLVIALGTRMSSQTTFDFDASLFRNLVHIDEIPEEPGRNFPIRLGIVSDLAMAIRALRARAGTPVRRGSVDRVGELRALYGVYLPPGGNGPATTPTALAAARDILPRETLVVGDCGLTLQYLKRYLPVYAPDGFFALYSLAPMGSGLPLALGVQLARPDEVVLCVIGDGGALVHLSELAVAAHYGLPLIVLVCNNRGYKQVSDRMEAYQGRSYACSLPPVDFAAAAKACGCDAYVAADGQEVATAMRSALARRRASLIEVRVDGDSLFDVTPERIRNWWNRMFPRGISESQWPFPKGPK